MIGVGLAAFALVMVVAYLVTRPFLALEPDGAGRDQLLEDRSRALSQLTDLEMEFETGKLGRDEFEALRAQRTAEIELAERGIDELDAERAPREAAGGARPAHGRPEGDGAASEEIERRIAARRRELVDAGCPNCNARIGTSDRFCRSCGEPLDTAHQTR